MTWLDFVGLPISKQIETICNIYGGKIISSEPNLKIVQINWKQHTASNQALTQLLDGVPQTSVNLHFISSEHREDWPIILRGESKTRLDEAATKLGGKTIGTTDNIIDIGKSWWILFEYGGLMHSIFNLEINVDRPNPITYYFDLLIGTVIEFNKSKKT